MSKIQTKNTLYTLIDDGDGAFRIQGHSTYCPELVRCQIVFPPMVGNHIVFIPTEGDYQNRPIRTTPIRSITED